MLFIDLSVVFAQFIFGREKKLEAAISSNGEKTEDLHIIEKFYHILYIQQKMISF